MATVDFASRVEFIFLPNHHAASERDGGSPSYRRATLRFQVARASLRTTGWLPGRRPHANEEEEGKTIAGLIIYRFAALFQQNGTEAKVSAKFESFSDSRG